MTGLHRQVITRAFFQGTLLAMVWLGCSRERPEARPAERVAVDSAASLDSLVRALDSAGGFFAADGRSPAVLVNARLGVDAFRAAGEPALHSLIDCLDDSSTTTTTDDRTEAPVARGTLCFEVLSAIVRDSGAALLPEAADGALYPGVPAEGPALKRAQRAWRAAVASGKYYWVGSP